MFLCRSCLAAVLVAGPLVSLSLACGSADEQERIEQGLKVSPVSLDLEGKDRDLVGLGSYLVNAQGGCTDCHTNPTFAPGGNPFAGEPTQENTAHFLAGGNAFPLPDGGTVIASNLTPDANGNPGGHTREDFLEMMRTGRHEGRILQVMPWPLYARMTERDLVAIYEYLRAIPHAEPGP